MDSAEDLVSHVNVTHIESFSGQDVVLCLWGGCKVYNVPSSSYRWLKQHVQQVHMKERPHKCFMNGCNMSFHSVEALQRHLQKHLEPTLPKSPKCAKASPVSKMKVKPSANALLSSRSYPPSPAGASHENREGAINDGVGH